MDGADQSAVSRAPRNKRSGGRAARVALRAAPLTEDKRPVRPGLMGGQYRPLTGENVQRIHQAALEALWEVGLSGAPESGVETLTKAGAVYADGRLYFPPALVEDMLSKAARNIALHGRDEAHDLHLEPNRVHYGTAGAAVHLVDVANNAYRECTLRDLYSMSSTRAGGK